MKRYKLTIAYDGTAYCGWQRQPHAVSTVQGTIEKAAGYIVSHPVVVQGSSRTDTGVHALGQIAAMNAETALEVETLRRAINSRLPGDILIRRMEEVPLEFDVRKAVKKRYRYLIWAHKDRPLFHRHYVYHFYRDLNLDSMQAACDHHVGTHDYAAFRGSLDKRDNTVRTIHSCTIRAFRPRPVLEPASDTHSALAVPVPRRCLVFGVEGSGFLYHMVRSMVGTIMEIGTGHWQPDCIPKILASKDRQQAGPCAPAVGLHLQWIKFPEMQPLTCPTHPV